MKNISKNTKKINVLYIVSTLRKSGPTNQLFEIIKHLDRNVFEPIILTMSNSPVDNRNADFKELGIHIESMNVSRMKSILLTREKINQHIKKYNPHIIHTSGVRADKMLAKSSFKHIHCMTIRNFAYDDYIEKYGWLIGKILIKDTIQTIEKCNVIYCSYSLKNKYSERIKENGTVIQNGVDCTKYTPVINYKSKERLRTKLNLPLDKKIFIMVGSLNNRKNPVQVINAFKEENNLSNSLLLIVGDGPLKLKFEDKLSNNILLVGKVDNVLDYLQASDIFVSSSRSEGLPNAVLEAGAVGLKLALSDIPEHREIFSEENQYVKYFPLDDQRITNIKFVELADKEFKIESSFTISEYTCENFGSVSMSKKYQDYYLKLKSDIL